MSSDPRQDFIATATDPLAHDPEIQQRGRDLLEQRVAPEPDGLPVLRRRRWPTWWAIALTLLVSALALFRPLRDAWTAASAYDGTIFLGIPMFDQDEMREHFGAGRPREEARLLVGEPAAASAEARWRPLWESEPDDPAIHARYFLARLETDGEVPEDLRDRAGELDPGNGWYDLASASTLGADVAEKERLPYAERKAGKLPGWTIHDPDRLDAALELAAQAARAERFDDPTGPLTARQYELLPPLRDLRSFVIRGAYSMVDSPGSTLGTLDLGKAITAAAWRCGEQGDLAELRRLVATHSLLSEKLHGSVDTVLDVLIARVFAQAPLADFVKAGAKLGMPEGELEELTGRERRVREYREEIRDRERPDEIETLFEQRGGKLTSMNSLLFAQVRNPPFVDPSDLTPGRRAEHAILGRIAMIVLWAVLAILGVGIALCMRFSGTVERRLAGSLGRGFEWRDFLWVTGIGVGGPFAGFLLLRFATPLGGLRWSFFYSPFPPVALQLGTLALLLLWVPFLAARWRVRRRFAALDPEPVRWPALAGLAGVAAAAPLAGLAAPDSPASETLAIVAAGILGLALMVLPLAAMLGRARRPDLRLDRCLAWQLAGPALPAGLLACLLVGAGFHLEERHWFGRDPFVQPHPQQAPWTAVEMEIAEQGRLEFEQVWNPGE